MPICFLQGGGQKSCSDGGRGWHQSYTCGRGWLWALSTHSETLLNTTHPHTGKSLAGQYPPHTPAHRSVPLTRWHRGAGDIPPGHWPLGTNRTRSCISACVFLAQLWHLAEVWGPPPHHAAHPQHGATRAMSITLAQGTQSNNLSNTAAAPRWV